MLLKTALRSWLFLGVLVLVACGDFTLVEPQPQPEEPLLSVHVSALSNETESTRYELSAYFRRGTDARGEPTEIADSALYVEGTPVLPEPETTPGAWLYRWQQTRAATGDGADSIRVAFPAIASSSPSTSSITIPVTRREGPVDVRLTRGQDLLLRVSSADGAPPGLSGALGFWTLEIRQSCSGGDPGPQFEIRGSSPYGSELRVPWQWLATLPGSSMSACFRAFSSFQVAGSPYRASVTVIVELVWRIQVIEPAA
jgi:hypothetical protein